jgi:uncharacterized membrane protein YfcA
VSTGLLGGFSTMIGNAAGPVLSVYLLSMKLPKNYFIGTGAWFFLIINLIKVPLHVFVWHTITVQSFSLNILMLPAIIVGAYLGIRLVKIIPDGPYRIFVIIITTLTALKLFM